MPHAAPSPLAAAQVQGPVGPRSRAWRQVDLAPRPDVRRARHRPHPHHRPAGRRGHPEHGQGATGAGLPHRQGAATPGRCWAAAWAGSRQPAGDLDFGNSGTGVRLMMGVIAGHDMTVRMTGDASLVAAAHGPGAQAPAADGTGGAGQGPRKRCRSPPRHPRSRSRSSISFPSPSAQIKSAVLIAGLHAAGETTVIEPEATRDHTERMLGHFGAQLTATKRQGVRAISIKGDAELAGQDVQGSRRSEFGRVPGRRGADRAGLGGDHRRGARQSDADRASTRP